MATYTVGPSGRDYTSIQDAVDAATYGDTIVCDANTDFVEQDFLLPNKGAGSSYITITTNASAGNLPPAGHRTDPSYEAFMPRIKSAGFGVSTVSFEDGAHHYKFQHVHFPNVPHGYNAMIAFGTAEQTLLANLPHHLIVDQCYLEGGDIVGQRVGVYLNGGEASVTNCYIEKCAGMGQDAQAIAGYNGTGPYTIDNNYLEGAAENTILGGSDPKMRWRMTTTGSVSTTGAAVSLQEPTGRDIGDLVVGDKLAIDVATGGTITLEFVELASITRLSASTATLTWTPALSADPDTTAGSIRHDVVADGVTITNNLYTKNTAWRNPILGTPANPSAALSAGGSLATTYYYKVQAGAVGYTEQDVNSASSTQVNATAGGGNGTITVDWDAVTNAEWYRVWRGTSSNGQTQYVEVTAPTSVLVDNGSLSWTTATIPSAGSLWVIKNLLQFKAVKNAVVSGNIFQNLWQNDTFGSRQAWWIKAENQNSDGGEWSCTCANIELHHNIIRGVYGWFLIAGRYCVNGSPLVYPDAVTDVNIHDNLIIDCNSTFWGDTEGRTMQIQDVRDLTINHNTIINVGMHSALLFSTPQVGPINMHIKNNMMKKGTYGVLADGMSEGTNSLDAFGATGGEFLNNTVAGANCGVYPATTLCPNDTNWEASFTSYSANGDPEDYIIATGHAYENAGTDGEDLGADIAAVIAATAYAEDGIPPSESEGRRVAFMRR